MSNDNEVRIYELDKKIHVSRASYTGKYILTDNKNIILSYLPQSGLERSIDSFLRDSKRGR